MRGRSRSRWTHVTAAILIAVVAASAGGTFTYAQNLEQDDPSTLPATVQTAAQQTPAQLQQLVAPIALYPDELVGQILGAATYPDEIVEADRWLQAHTSLTGEPLAQAVDQQPWDPAVKALTEFPSVLANMDKNLSWTSSLGDAYINQQQAVMDAIQVMRTRAQKAGNLKTTSQQTVESQGSSIVIAPANPQVVYVPQYNPWLVYGAPVVAWPGWYGYPGLFWNGPGIGFGLGFGLGFFGGFGWGWGHWGADWGRHSIINNHNTYISHSRTFANRGAFNGRGGGNFGRAGGFHGGGGFDRGGAFHGGGARGFSDRGRSSFGGFHGGGGFGGGRGGGGFGGGHGGGGGGRR